MTSWTTYKDLGARSFSSKNYHEALAHYTRAIDLLSSHTNGEGNEANEVERQHQILLSNVIACRLKIGGEEMANKAVEEAQQCIALNPNWSKAHIRLASAYIAQGDHSNDACQALQRALSLDPSNKVARQMLVKELRRRDGGGSSTTQSAEGQSGSETRRTENHAGPSAPPASSFSEQSTSQSNHHPNTNNNIDIDDIPPQSSNQSLSAYIQNYLTKAIAWYHSQSDDVQTLIKVSFCFLLLYIALGGRFGLEYALGNRGRTRGNYGEGNVYERYGGGRGGSSVGSGYNDEGANVNYYDAYRDANQQQQERRETTYSSQQYTSSHTGDQSNQYSTAQSDKDDPHSTGGSGYNDRYNPRNERYYSRYNTREDYYERPRPRGTNTSFQLPNLFNGSPTSMVLLFLIGSICHYFGINPFHVFWMLNMAQNRGRGGRMYGMGRGGFGGGFGGGGFGYGGMRRGRFGRRGGYY